MDETVDIKRVQPWSDTAMMLIDTNDVHIACLPRFGIAAQRMLDMGITPTAVLTETGDVWSIFQK